MKWLWIVTTAVAVTGLVALGILSVDERDVVWEGREAFCPYCRAPLPNLALACPTCRRTFDWVPTTETCRHCLSPEDVDHLRNAFRALDGGKEPLPGALAEFPAAYFAAMQPGDCTFCAGLKEVVEGGRDDVRCPVCRGEGRCIACGGSRSVAIGEPAGRKRLLDRRGVWERAAASAAVTRLPVNRADLLEADVRSLRGYVEAEELLSPLLDRAAQRIRDAFAALHEELAKKPKAVPAAAGS